MRDRVSSDHHTTFRGTDLQWEETPVCPLQIATFKDNDITVTFNVRSRGEDDEGQEYVTMSVTVDRNKCHLSLTNTSSERDIVMYKNDQKENVQRLLELFDDISLTIFKKGGRPEDWTTVTKKNIDPTQVFRPNNNDYNLEKLDWVNPV